MFAIPRFMQFLIIIMLLNFQLVLGLIVFPASPAKTMSIWNLQHVNLFGSKVYAHMVS